MTEKKKILERLSQLDSCSVSDALDKLEIKGIALGLYQLTSTKKISGQVLTMKLANTNSTVEYSNKLHLGVRAIGMGNEDNIIVIEHSGKLNVAGWGGILSQAASRKGIKGVIIDGAIRDIDESKRIDFPIYGKAGVPITARNRVGEIAVNKPITICGINLKQGDYTICDGSGIVFIPSQNIKRVVELAEEISHKEKKMLINILKGQSVSQVMDKKYEDLLNNE